MTDNLLDPLLLTHAQAQKLALSDVCAYCGNQLILSAGQLNMYNLSCPEHGPVYDHTHISRNKWAKARSNQSEGMIQLHKPSGLTPEEIIKKLGF